MSDPDNLMVRSVEKAMRVIAAFGNGQPALSLAEVAAHSGMDKSAAQRFAHTWIQLGYMRRDPESRRLELTPRVLEFAAFYSRSNQMIRAAAPYLLNISKVTEESVSLTVLDGTDIVYVYRLLSRNMLTTDVIIGTHLPAYCTAPGLAILSGLPPDDARAILEASDRVAYTPSTVTDTAALMERIGQASQRGFAVAEDQIYANDISVAVPVFGPGERAVAAVNIAVNKLSLSAEQAVEKFVPLLSPVAKNLSHAGRLSPRKFPARRKDDPRP
ncbi:IclR family transcriptional regulator [Bosea sp. UC22_33]|uniref:IclR family transcriptional regulator n=1 Tax=Bosea sp. UC22_33 TaxID=3350165 RepID=UPI00367225A6